jgi:hypothetical protein
MASPAATWRASNFIVRAKDKETEEVIKRLAKREHQRNEGDKELTGDSGI